MKNKIEAIIMIKILVIAVIYSAIAINSVVDVQAQQQNTKVCCEKTKSGDLCVLTDDLTQCDPDFTAAYVSSCNNLAACQPVCCIGDDGVCNLNTPKLICGEGQGQIAGSSDCKNVAECSQGCCKISKTPFVTSRSNCQEIVEEFTDINVDEIFDPLITDYNACLLQGRLTESGCCVIDESCSFTTAQECLQITKNPQSFNLNKLCSNINSCNCSPKYAKGCLPNEDDVYWFDSCGNPENIALECDYNLGNSCGQDDNGEFICKNLNCETTYEDPRNPSTGGFRGNGESWCVYDGKVGPGLDLVGSRHFVNKCVNGQEIAEPCRDFREEVCVQADLVTNTDSSRVASCKPNNYEECVTTCNTVKDATSVGQYNVAVKKDFKCCQENLDSCLWTGKDDTSGSCIPIVPPGFASYANLEHSSRIPKNGDGTNICSLADRDCTVVWFKPPIGSWKCVSGCDCLKDEYAYQFNQYCNALGDCGAYYNVNGEYTYDGYSCERDEGLSCTGAKHGDSFSLDNFDQLIPKFSTLTNSGDGLYQGEVKIFDPSSGEGKDAAYWGTLVGSGVVTFSLVGTAVASLVAANIITTATPLIGSLLGALGATGIGLVVAVIVIIVLTVILGSGKKDDTTFHFSCLPWQPPIKGDCNYCNELQGKHCSEYVCKSLGRNCQFINVGTKDELCTSVDINDVSPPKISSSQKGLKPGFTLQSTANGYNIKEIVPAYSIISLAIETDEIARCRLSQIPNELYDKKLTFLGDGGYLLNHNITFRALPGGKTYDYYVKCEDYYGNQNTKDYKIQFTIDSGPDISPPIIENTIPPNKVNLPADINAVNVTLLLNEPGECKLSKNANIKYESMETILNCFNTTNFNLCNAEIYGISSNYESINYIKCQDPLKNTNTQDYIYTIGGSSPLQILTIKPQGEVYTPEFTLEVTTSSIASCKFNGIDFFNTGSSKHTQKLSPPLGNTVFTIDCFDESGNHATKTTEIYSTRDIKGPEITRLYRQDDSLVIQTDEQAICEYNDKGFVFGTGTKITNTLSNQHSLLISKDKFYLICKDEFENSMSMIIIYP